MSSEAEPQDHSITTVPSRKCFVQAFAPSNNDDDAASTATFENNNKSFFKSAPNGKIQVQRPKTTLKKLYHSDGIFYSNFTNEFYTANISPLLISSLDKGCDFMLWTYGSKQTGKSTLVYGCSDDNGLDSSVGYLSRIAFDIGCNFLSSSQSSTKISLGDEKESGDIVDTIISISYLAVTGDETDRAYDCLASTLFETENNSKLKLRETEDKLFYMEGLNDIQVKSIGEMKIVLKNGCDMLTQLKSGEVSQQRRMHSLVTFTIRRIYDNGDLVQSRIQVLDLCGAERPTTGSVAAKRAMQAKKNAGTNSASSKQQKEDRTLRAISRVVDSLSRNKSHVPYRDSKLTRLTNQGLGGVGPSSWCCTLAIMSISIENDGMFDQTNAVLEFMSKVRQIQPPSIKTFGDASSLVVRKKNRQRELKDAIRRVVDLSSSSAAFLDIMATLDLDVVKAEDIELDMNSPMELVDLRDAIATIQALRVDPLEDLRRNSDKWWSTNNNNL